MVDPHSNSEMGQYIVEEYTRRHHRFSVTALAEAARVDRGTIYLILRGHRPDGTPVQPMPDTLRAVAYAVASGDSDTDAGERIYARLADLAGYLPRVPAWTPPPPAEVQRMTDEEQARIMREAEQAVIRRLLSQVRHDEGEGA